MVRFLTFLLSLLTAFSSPAQHITLLSEGTKSSLRGLSVVNNLTVWVSGSNGTVGRSIDGGITWFWHIVPGFEKNEFRDVEAFSETEAVVMSIGSPAYILRTVDAGESWQVVFKDTSAAMFLDAMEFWNRQSGIVIGDPIDGRFFIARTFDGGKNWQPVPFLHRPIAAPGEAAFAASGTNIRPLTLKEAVFVTGADQSNLFYRNQKLPIPFLHSESSGANSIAIKNKNQMVVVGGDYLKSENDSNNCFYSTDGGRSWNLPATPPGGYRSCVEFIAKKTFISCGLNGVDISDDLGKNWRPVSNKGFHVVRKAKWGNAIYFAGANGQVAKWQR